MPRKRPPKSPDYGNRTDLQQAAQTPAAPTGMEYGTHQASIDAQRSMPLPDLQAPTDPLAGAEAAAQALPYEPIGLGAPSARPDEPLTAGLPIGAGPGPEALGERRNGRITDMLQRIAAAAGDPALQTLADEAASQGI